MAKATGPLFSIKARGKFANTLLYQAQPGANIVYKFHKPTGKPSYQQHTQRRLVEFILAQWIGMTNDQKEAWRQQARQSNTNLPGYHYFLRRAHHELYAVTGLAAYYSLNEPSTNTCHDTSPNANNLTLQPTYPTDAPTRTPSLSTKLLTALKFNGLTQYASAPTSPTLENTPLISVDFFLKPSTLSTEQFLISKGGGFSRAGWTICTLPTTQIRFNIGNGSSETLLDAGTITTNKWHYIVATFNGATMRIYINGILQTPTATPPYQIPINSNPLMVAMGDGPIAFPFTGTIDEIRILNRAMTQAEISYIYSKNKTPS